MADEQPLSSLDSNVQFDEEDDDDITIPNALRFTLESLKILSQNPLTAQNHLFWSIQVQTIFKASNYTKYLHPNFPIPLKLTLNADGTTQPNPLYKKWNLINCHLLAALKSTISPSLHSFIIDKETIGEIWKAIHNRLQPQSKSRTMQLRDEITTLSLKGDNIATYISTTKTIVDNMRAAGLTMSDDDIIYYMLKGLPSMYNSFRSSFRLKSEDADLNSFYALLVSEEINIATQNNLENPSPNLALNTYRGDQRGRGNNGRGRGRGNRPTTNTRGRGRPNAPGPSSNPPSECQICSKMGHSAKTCWYRYAESNNNNNQSTKQAYMADQTYDQVSNSSLAGPSSCPPDEWYLDSGASTTLTNNYQNLQNPTTYNGHDSITIGNGAQLPITHVGQHTLSTTSSPEVDRVAAIAGKYKVFLVMGVIERAGYTLYCTVLFFDPVGQYLGKHRKFVPTGLERVIWGFGDGSTIPVYETPLGRIGAVICWENKMPLLRTAMYGKGIEIYCAPTAEDREVWQASMTHIALEGGCFVLSANQFCRRKDYPPPPDYEFAGLDEEPSPNSVVCAGGSVIISPSGVVLAGPNYEGESLITADLDMGEIVRAKFAFDVVGHYSRPDVLSLTVKDHPQLPVFFTSASKKESEQKS